MKSQAYGQYGMMGRVYQGCSRAVIFLRAVRGFFQLLNFASRVRTDVLGNVNYEKEPQTYLQMLRASLSESLIYYSDSKNMALAR